MGREQGTFKFAANLEIEKGAPLDSRMLVQNISDLTDNGTTWNAKDNKKYLFNGLIVSVIEDNSLYMLTDAENYTNINSWKKINTGLSSSTDSTAENLAATPKAVKEVYDLANSKQDALVSGTNIKTINGTSLLGGDDIKIKFEQEQSDWNETDSTNKTYIKNKPNLATVATTGLYSDLSGTPSLATVATSGSYNDLSNKPNLSAVATSGSYNDLSNKPTIPAEVTETTVSGWGFTKNKGTITGVTMNNQPLTVTDGSVDLGTVVTGLTTANTSNYGVTKLVTTTGTSEVLAATQSGMTNVYKIATSAQTEVKSLRDDFNTLVSGNTDEAINNFNEITKFLEDFNTGETLTEKLYDINALINENELVVANALNDLNEQIGKCGDISAVDINQEIDDTNITNYITNPVFTEELNKKQDNISDLTTIRSNAEKGSTAVQPNDIPSLAVTGIKMNGSSKGTNGVVDLGTIVTGEHLTNVVSGVTTGHTANQLYGKNSNESRSVISDPNEYNHLFKFTGLKDNSALGLNNEGTYSSVAGVRAWSDSSGGPAHEFAYTQTGKIYHRYGNTTGDTSWQNWKKMVESDELVQCVTTGTTQTISGVKNFTNNIEIGKGTSATTSVITNQIDSGELKVYHSGTTKGFIIRTNNKGNNANENLFPLELLTTNNYSSYQYNFPTKTGGTVVLNTKINGNLYTPSTTGGTIDLGNGYLTQTNVNDEVLFENLEEVTYTELLDLVNTCSLVKGRNYRIIDYITTTTQTDTQSVGKPFDVIVTALSNNTLDENAKVCHPKGVRKTYGGTIYGINGIIKSTYATPYNWAEITLDKKLKKVIYDYEAANNNTIQNEYKIVRDGYTVNASGGTLNVKLAPRANDIRVVGVEVCDANNRNNVIDSDYHLSDITTNDTTFTGNYYVSVPTNGSYFVRLIFIKPASTSSEVNIEVHNYSGHYFNENDLSKWVIKYDIHNDTNKYLWADATNGKGVIYYMKDEFDNECPYDFKNIKFKRTKQWVDDNNLREPNDELKFNESEKYFYTFDWNGTDDSLCKGTYKCEQNKIEKLLSGKQQQLNNNIFLGNGNANNKIGANSKNNVIGVDSYNNEFGVNFQNNIILHKFTYNTIGNGFQNNVCRGTFRYNNISHLVSDNKFISSFNYNTVSENVKNNTFSGTTQYNTIGAIVQNNIFSDIMYYCNIGTNLSYCSTFPGLHSVTIEPGILEGTSGSPIDLSSVYVGNTPLTVAIVNKKPDGQWANKGILLYKDNDDKYYISSTNNSKESYIKITYSELVELRDNSQLTPGCKYRITDYVTTTAQENTRSANRPFDIIVEALTENTLSENAKACLHEGDTYFSENNAKLEAWEIKYCIDNDSDRFAWADGGEVADSRLVNINEDLVNGNKFITPFVTEYTIRIDGGDAEDYTNKADYFYEYDRETNPDGLENQLCIYKSDLEMYEEEGADYADKFFYYGTEIVDGQEYDKWRKGEINSEGSYNWYHGDNQTSYYILTQRIVENPSDIINLSSGKGVIYYMKDEWGNECPYDFKNITFIRYKLEAPDINGEYSEEWQGALAKQINIAFEDDIQSYLWSGIDENEKYWEDDMSEVYSNNTHITKAFFTFSNFDNDIVTDKSLTEKCYNNIIKECTSNSQYYLNNNIVVSTQYHDCSYNTFGMYCDSNTFGDNCNSNTFGDDCRSNTFGNGCNANTFGYECSSNTFGNGCSYNTFGNGCTYNTFGMHCRSNTFGNEYYYNTFGNACTWIAFYDDSAYEYKNGEYIYDAEKLDLISNISLDKGCSNLLFYPKSNLGTIGFNNKINNITVTKGVSGSNGLLTLEIPVTNNEYELKIARNSSGNIKIYCEADLID